jgi:hypothetical protein
MVAASSVTAAVAVPAINVAIDQRMKLSPSPIKNHITQVLNCQNQDVQDLRIFRIFIVDSRQ